MQHLLLSWEDIITDSPAPVPAQQPHAARSESSSPSPDDDQEDASLPSMLQRVRTTIPPVSILILTVTLLFAGWFTLFGSINVLAWRGGTSPRTEVNRPYYQQALKDVTHYQCGEQPSPEVYFGLACGATDASIRSVTPKVDGHPDSDADPTADGGAVTATVATRPDSTRAAASQISKLNPNLDAFGDMVDCSGFWAAPFLSFLLASADVPVFNTPENSITTTENPWLVTDVEQLMSTCKAHDVFVTNKGFSPQVGDIVFYRYPTGLEVHANMIVVVQGSWVIIGDDELGKVGLASMTLCNRDGIVSYSTMGYFEQAPLDTTK